MKSVRIVIAVAFLLGAPTWSRSEDVATDPLQSALRAGRYADAYELVNERVRRDPANNEIRALASQVALATGRPDEAEMHLSAALERSPGDVLLLMERAWLRQRLGNTAGAWLDARLIAQLDPTSEFAPALLKAIDAMDRAAERLAGSKPAVPPGSPEAYVDRLCSDLANGAWPAVIAGNFDLSILDGVAPEHRRLSTLVMVLEGILETSWKHGERFLGWAVAPAEAHDERWTVPVVVLVASTFDPAETVAAHADPRRREKLPDFVRAMLDTSPPDERAAFLDRLSRMKLHDVGQIRVEVVRKRYGYRVSNVERGDYDMKASIEKAAPLLDSPGGIRWFRVGATLGALAAVVVLIWLIVHVVNARRGRG